MNEADRPLLLRPEQAGSMLGIGRSKVYELLANGRLPSLHIGKRRLIERRELEVFVERLRGEQAVDV